MPVPAANPRVSYQVVFVDEHILVVEKPRGRVTQPGRGHLRDSLVNGVFADYGARLARLGARRDYGLLHRLDRATSGLVVFALSPEAYDTLRESFAARKVEKTYLALVRSRPPKPRGVTRLRLRQVRRGDLQLSIPDPRGAEAVTTWKTLATRGGRTVLSCQIETGRLHQIRAHLAALGCPVDGDTVYGGPSGLDTRASVARAADRSLLLHAWRLRFGHPLRRKRVRCESVVPSYFAESLAEAGIDLGGALSESPENL